MLFPFSDIAQACEDGWFGTECQYKCRCQQACSPEGECPDKCEIGWFSYKCQYSIAEYRALTEDADLTSILTDNDDTTCINIGTDTIQVKLKDVYYNHWIRLFTLKPELIHNLKISLLNENRVSVTKSKERYLLQDNFVDIYIPVENEYITIIILEGEAIRRLCSLWFIIGQNVAIKQNAYYSNSDIDERNTNLSQYPQATDGLRECSTSDTRIAGTTWELVMNPSFLMKTYYFYVNDTIGDFRNNTIKTFDNFGTLSVFVVFIGTSSGRLYGFIDISTKPTGALTFSLTSWSTNKSLTLLLCEVEAFTVCREGTWGLHCRNKCNKSCPDFCRFDDGLCSNGCLGYSDPPKCTQECVAGTWGLNCIKRCSNQCFNSTCDKITGVCDLVCIGYSNPPQCTIACTAGSYGSNCSLKCSDQCLKQTCDAITGHCIHCREGFQGLFCEQVIKISDGFSEQTIIAIAVSLASAALIALVIFLIALKATGKLCFERKENM
uniref:EGF-like domain-containing protein n=1 Tax=Biomphalaria glabrata TaxID=6526 RepID=A0A2C9L6A3_BIOGL